MMMNASIATVLGFLTNVVTQGTITKRPGIGSTNPILDGESTNKRTEVFWRSACPFLG